MKKLKFLAGALAIADALFLLLFSLDVLTSAGSFFEKLGGFILHSIPSILLAGALIFTWKKPKIAAIVYLIIGIAFTVFFKTYVMLDRVAIISLPPVLVAVLFFMVSTKDKK
jgi:hypothetical protein